MTAAPPTSQDASSETLLSLDQHFLYQHVQTGEISKTQLTSQQLIRLLCPASSVVRQMQFTGETQLLALEVDGSYSKEGWRPAKNTPILKEALAAWYYESDGTQGPCTCRQLAELYRTQEITDTTRVYAAETCPEWTCIGKLPFLQAALHALETQTPKWKLNEEKASEKPSVSDTTADQPLSQDIQDELHAFLTSTEHMGPTHVHPDEEDYEVYESDGGTRYVKDPHTGNWIHQDLAPARPKKASAKEKNHNGSSTGSTSSQQPPLKKKKKPKPKFSAKKAKCWVYVTGLPVDTTEDEVAQVFSKAGIIDLHPETQHPKIKLYRHKDGPNKGECKGDASVCYARPESVELALTLLDESYFRPSVNNKDAEALIIHVERAKFRQDGSEFRPVHVSEQKRQVAKLAALQAMDWDEGDFNRRLTGGRKGLRIIVLKHLFQPPQTNARLESLEHNLHAECERFGEVEKITVFSQHPDGVVIVKFAQPGPASEAVKELHGRQWKEVGRIDASFWDGVTDYTLRDEVKEETEMKKRHEEFGNWLDHQDIPEHLQLKTEDDS